MKEHYDQPNVGYSMEDLGIEPQVFAGRIKYIFHNDKCGSYIHFAHITLLSRSEAMKLLQISTSAAYNYELELQLDRSVGLGFVINEPDKCNIGRYAKFNMKG